MQQSNTLATAGCTISPEKRYLTNGKYIRIVPEDLKQQVITGSFKLSQYIYRDIHGLNHLRQNLDVLAKYILNLICLLQKEDKPLSIDMSQ